MINAKINVIMLEIKYSLIIIITMTMANPIKTNERKNNSVKLNGDVSSSECFFDFIF